MARRRCLRAFRRLSPPSRIVSEGLLLFEKPAGVPLLQEDFRKSGTIHLLTPEDERFERFSIRLLDFELREQLLLAHQDELTREEKDAYRRLPDAGACRRFVLERAATAHVSTTTRR